MADDSEPASEEKPEGKPSRLIERLDQISRAWVAAGVSANCEVCSHTNWSVEIDESFEGFGLTARNKNSILIGTLLAVDAVVCQNCGNVRIFASNKITDLSRERGDDDSGGGEDDDPAQ